MAAKVWVGGVADHTTEWNQANNWSPAGVPADLDSVRFTKDAAYNLETYAGTAGEIDATASGTIQFAGFYVDEGCTANIGQASSWLKLDVSEGTTHDIKLGGSGTVYLIAAETALVMVSGPQTVYFVGDTATANSLNITHGSAAVYVGKTDGTSVEFDTVNCTAGATVVLYSGLTAINGTGAPALNLDSGTATSYCPLGTVQQNSGSLYHKEGTLTTLTVATGTCYYESVGTLTTVYVLGGGILDFGNDFRAKTVTNASVYIGARISDPLGVVTWTNGIDLVKCMPSEVTIEVDRDATWTPSAI